MDINMRKLIATILFVLIWSSVGFGANRIAYEDFEGVTPGNIPSHNPTGSGEISRSGRPFYGSGGNGAFLESGGNPGKHARAYIQSEYIGGSSYTEPKWYFDNKLGGKNELYIKFDLKIDTNLGATVSTREITDFKFVMITDNSTASSSASWKCYFQVNPSGSYSWYAWGGSEYYFANAIVNRSNLKMWDHNWHTYEVYIKLGTHITVGDKNDSNNDTIVKLWEDGVLILEDHKVPVRSVDGHYTLNSAGFVSHAFSLKAPVQPMAGNLYYDNIEVWDGMPDGGGVTVTPPPSDSTPPTVPSNHQAISVSQSQIDLSWTASTDNVGVTGYRIFRDNTELGTTQTTSFSDTGLSPSTTYTYTVSAYDAAGNESGQSGSISATTLIATESLATESLLSSNIMVANSQNFDPNRPAENLWDGIINSGTAGTAGAGDISSFWLEFDFGQNYDLTLAQLFGDANGKWVSTTWTLQYKQNINSAWQTAFANVNAFFNGWSSRNLTIKARYVRVEVFGNPAIPATQAGELEIYGAPSSGDTQPPAAPKGLKYNKL